MIYFINIAKIDNKKSKLDCVIFLDDPLKKYNNFVKNPNKTATGNASS